MGEGDTEDLHGVRRGTADGSEDTENWRRRVSLAVNGTGGALTMRNGC